MSNNLDSSQQALQTARHITDLKVGENGIELRDYVNTPFIGRIISYFRSKFVNENALKTELTSECNRMTQSVLEAAQQTFSDRWETVQPRSEIFKSEHDDFIKAERIFHRINPQQDFNYDFEQAILNEINKELQVDTENIGKKIGFLFDISERINDVVQAIPEFDSTVSTRRNEIEQEEEKSIRSLIKSLKEKDQITDFIPNVDENLEVVARINKNKYPELRNLRVKLNLAKRFKDFYGDSKVNFPNERYISTGDSLFQDLAINHIDLLLPLLNNINWEDRKQAIDFILYYHPNLKAPEFISFRNQVEGTKRREDVINGYEKAFATSPEPWKLAEDPSVIEAYQYRNSRTFDVWSKYSQFLKNELDPRDATELFIKMLRMHDGKFLSKPDILAKFYLAIEGKLEPYRMETLIRIITETKQPLPDALNDQFWDKICNSVINEVSNDVSAEKFLTYANKIKNDEIRDKQLTILFEKLLNEIESKKLPPKDPIVAKAYAVVNRIKNEKIKQSLLERIVAVLQTIIIKIQTQMTRKKEATG